MLFLFFATGQLPAQNPGYMGKRFTAGYGIYASPGYFGSGGLTAVNLLHEGFIEAALTKSFSLVLSAKVYKGANKNELDANGYLNGISNVPTGQIDIKERNYAFFLKFYTEGSIAPWGRYFLIGPSLQTFEVSYDPDDITKWPADGYGFGETRQNAMMGDVMFGNGRSRVITNRISIDYGYQVGVWGATSFLLSGDVFGDFFEVPWSLSHSLGTYNVKTGRVRVTEINRFNLYLKVGYLF